jgi:3-oxoacyl-[acyl-carrier protein] reductase
MTVAKPGALTGTVTLVTGGSSGIGAAIATAFAQEGSSIAVVASKSLAKAEAVSNTIATSGGTAKPFVADVRDPAAIKALVASVEATLGPIDILVNSAGVFYATPLDNTPAATFDQMVDINIKGAWHCIEAVTPGMKARKRGWIINLASVAGTIGITNYSGYCATKAAVIIMTKAMARELAPHGININAIAPGNTATPMNEAVRAPENAEMYEAMRKMTPSGTVFSAAEEVAGTALFLVSPAARPMHGATLLMDEGISTGL